MVEVEIHCNVMKCRRSLLLEAQACVTSCSHIFCVQCSNQFFSKALICPACNTSLSGNDDIILTELNPTEEYKSSVLAGLKPEIIMDICTRSIAFYEYQTSQEILYRTMLQKNTEEKYMHLKDQFNLVTRDLNHIIKTEKDKQSMLANSLELEKIKSQQVMVKLEEKSKQFQKLQIMYEKLKRKTIVPNIHQQQQQQQQQESMISIPMISYNNTNNTNTNKKSLFIPFAKNTTPSTVIQTIYPVSTAQQSTAKPSPNFRRLTHLRK